MILIKGRKKKRTKNNKPKKKKMNSRMRDTWLTRSERRRGRERH